MGLLDRPIITIALLKDYTKMDTFTEPKNLNVLFKNDDPSSKFKRNAEGVIVSLSSNCQQCQPSLASFSVFVLDA